jgi:exopolysaccharide production protein ExoQ
MVAYFREAGRRANAVSAAVVALLGLVAAYAGVQLNGTKTGMILALSAVLGPVVVVLAITSPVLFPFGLYAFLTPFDALLSLSSGSGGTLTAVLGAGSAAALLFLGMRYSRRFADPDMSVGIWLVYTLWIAASAFWAIDPNLSFAMMPTALELFGLYAIVSLIRIKDRELSTVLQLTAAGGICAAIYLLYLAHTGVAIHEDRMYLRTSNYYWNPDFLATALILPVLISVCGTLWNRTFAVRGAWAAGACLIMIAVILTGARGPELGIIAGILYLVIKDRARRWKLAGLLAALGAIAGVFYGPSLGARWSQALTDGGAGRTDIWKVGWAAFQHNWLFGAGFNNFQQAYNQVFMQVFQPQYIGWSHDSHNIVVGNGVELGIVGLGILLFAWYTQFRALRHVGQSDSRYPVRLCLEASLIGLFVAGLFADIMLVKCAWLAFILVNLTRNTEVSAPAAQGAVIENA